MFACRLCKLELINISNYIVHCRKHYKLQIPCTNCNIILSSAKAFRRHYFSAHEKPLRITPTTTKWDPSKLKIKCGHCKINFQSIQEFRSHVRTEVYAKGLVVDCPFCNRRSLSTYINLRVHVFR